MQNTLKFFCSCARFNVENIYIYIYNIPSMHYIYIYAFCDCLYRIILFFIAPQITNETALQWYKHMVTLNQMDNILYDSQRQVIQCNRCRKWRLYPLKIAKHLNSFAFTLGTYFILHDQFWGGGHAHWQCRRPALRRRHILPVPRSWRAHVPWIQAD